MSEFKIKSFAEYQRSLNESTDNSTVEEDRHKEKTVYNDNRGKQVTDNTKIKIAMGTPDTNKGEVLKFDFKYVNSEEIDPTAAKRKAIDELTSMISSQVTGGQLKSDMVGVIDIKKDQTRAVGDYVYTGAVSFYQGNHFTPDQLQSATAIATIPDGTPTPAANATPDQPVPTVKEEVTMPLFEDLKIYDASTIGSAEVKADLQSMLDASSKIEEPKQETPPPATPPPATPPPATPPPATPPPATGPSYANIAKNLQFNKSVQELQQRIITKGGPAAETLKQRGGADGKFGDNTAKAIAQVIGTPDTPITAITQEISDKLNAALGPVAAAAPVAQVVSVKTNNPKVPNLYF
jgi:hypothetical protein